MVEFVSGVVSWMWIFTLSNPLQVLLAYVIIGIAWASFKWFTNLVKLRSHINNNLDRWKETAEQQFEKDQGSLASAGRTVQNYLDKIFEKNLDKFLDNNDFGVYSVSSISYPLRISDFIGVLTKIAAFWPYYVLVFCFADVGKLIWNTFSVIFNAASNLILPEVKIK